MLGDRDYMRRPSRGRMWSATIALLIANVAVYLFQFLLMDRLSLGTYFALSLDGMRAGYAWQLLTYQFMHGSWFHLLVNCWALFVFGRELEWHLGKVRFLV